MRSKIDLKLAVGAPLLVLAGCGGVGFGEPPVDRAALPPPRPAPERPTDVSIAENDPSADASPERERPGADYAAPDAYLRPAPRPAAGPQPAPDFGAPVPSRLPIRYDNVGYAVWSAEAGTIAAAHPSLPPGTFAEVTALDTGRTILVPITATSRPGREIELSGAAAQQLGLGYGGQAGVRVRAANASGGDMTALRAGQPAPARPETPPVLLNALRRKLAGTLGQAGPAREPTTSGNSMAEGPPPASARPPRPQTAPRSPAQRAVPRGYYVQVAALSDLGRARAVAHQVRGMVSSAGALHRVRTGPFATPAAAQAARDAAAARGYGDARIVRQD